MKWWKGIGSWIWNGRVDCQNVVRDEISLISNGITSPEWQPMMPKFSQPDIPWMILPQHHFEALNGKQSVPDYSGSGCSGISYSTVCWTLPTIGTNWVPSNYSVSTTMYQQCRTTMFSPGHNFYQQSPVNPADPMSGQ